MLTMLIAAFILQICVIILYVNNNNEKNSNKFHGFEKDISNIHRYFERYINEKINNHTHCRLCGKMMNNNLYDTRKQICDECKIKDYDIP
jgi:hypothetical protein